MSIIMPEDMNECVYFTNRTLENNGKIIAFTKKRKCPECNKGLMGKPVNPKTGRPKTRATTYECPLCKYEEPKIDHEKTLIVEAIYTCPHCGKEGESTCEYKRKKYQGVDAYVILCEHCNGKIGITKKMKAPKKKKTKK